jgi:hypothetical protein
MNSKIETNKVRTEVIIDDDCGYEKFYKVADIIKNSFKLEFTEKLDDFDTLYWDFTYKESTLPIGV